MSLYAVPCGRCAAWLPIKSPRPVLDPRCADCREPRHVRRQKVRVPCEFCRTPTYAFPEIKRPRCGMCRQRQTDDAETVSASTGRNQP